MVQFPSFSVPRNFFCRNFIWKLNPTLNDHSQKMHSGQSKIVLNRLLFFSLSPESHSLISLFHLKPLLSLTRQIIFLLLKTTVPLSACTILMRSKREVRGEERREAHYSTPPLECSVFFEGPKLHVSFVSSKFFLGWYKVFEDLNKQKLLLTYTARARRRHQWRELPCRCPISHPGPIPSSHESLSLSPEQF